MADPILEWTDDADVPIGGVDFPFGKLAPAASSSIITRRLHNDRLATGTDTATDLVLVPQARIVAIHGDEWQAEDVDALDRAVIEIRSTTILSLSAFRPVGTNNSIDIPDLPSATFHEFEIRLTLPVGLPEVVVFLKLATASLRFKTIGNSNAMQSGIWRGVGRGVQAGGTAVLSNSGDVVASGLDTLEWTDQAWMYEGVPNQELDHDVVLTEADGAAASPLAGESYIFLALLNATATTELKGLKKTGPVFPADAPATPSGNIVVGWGERFKDSDAVPMTFTLLAGAEPAFFNVTTSGLNFTVAGGGGTLVTGGRSMTPTSSAGGSLTASSTNTVQILIDGSVAVTLDGSLTAPDAMVLVDILTDGSGETSRAERRRFADRSNPVEFFFDTPTGTTTLAVRNPFDRDLFFKPESMELMLDAVPGAGNAKADLFTRPDNGARTTLFTSFGSDDRRPVVTSGDSTAINTGVPEVLVWRRGEILECDLLVTTATPAYGIVTAEADME